MNFRSILTKVDDGLYAVERLIIWSFFLVMGGVVFLDVVYRISVSSESRLAPLWIRFGFGEELAHGVLGPLTVGVIAILLMYAAVRERWGDTSSRPKALGMATAIIVGIVALLPVFIWVFPNGLYWSQPLALAMMLWLGMLGASIAAREQRHLSLEFGRKVWPASMQRHVRVVAGVVVALFCAFLTYLAWGLIVEEFVDYQAGVGRVFGVGVPRFLVFAILPYGFMMICFRFLAGSLQGEPESAVDQILKSQQQDPSA